MKKVFVVLCCMIISLGFVTLVGCGSGDAPSSDSQYIGKWQAVSAEFKGEAVDINEVLEGEQFIIDLHDDGTATVSEGTADESEATWTETDKGVKVEGDDINMEFADNDGKLSCKILGVKMFFQKVDEESAVPTVFYGEYGYMGDDPVEGAVYEYAATEFPKGYEPDEDTISIPIVDIIDKVENEDGSVDVSGVFEIYNYKIEGDTLMTQSGGSHPGKMHLVKDEEAQVEAYKVESFDAVGDGSQFEPTAKEIFGDNYDKFMEVNSDEEALAALRTETIANYVQATGIEVTKYQDYGWDPVEITK